MKLRRLLKAYRIHYELNMRTMAKELGVSTATISRIENGKNIDADTLLKLINWLFETEEGCII